MTFYAKEACLWTSLPRRADALSGSRRAPGDARRRGDLASRLCGGAKPS